MKRMEKRESLNLVAKAKSDRYTPSVMGPGSGGMGKAGSEMGQATTLRGIYDPILEDLERVEKLMKDELSSDNLFVASLTEHSGRFAGKRIRPAMLLYSARICGGVTDTHRALAVVVELLHSATLVHDDVLDEADIRRQVKTLNSVWGNEASILFGDYLFAKAFLLCARLNSHEANVILAQTTQDMCLGELSQIKTKFDFTMDEARYEQIIRQKTAELFGTACRLGSVGWEADRETVAALGSYGDHFGMAFQIVDDCLDVTGDEREVGKSLGTDLAKGKLTLPVIRLLGILQMKERRELQDLIRAPEGLAEKRNTLVRLLREHDVMPYCLERAEHHLECAKRSARDLKEPLAENLTALADFALKRRA